MNTSHRLNQLPLSIHGLTPYLSKRKVLSPKWWRRRVWSLLATMGIVGGLVGAWVAQSGTAIPVYSYNGKVYVGPNILNPQGNGSYAGSGYYVVTKTPQGLTKAAASADVQGGHSTGVCLMTSHDDGSVAEGCTFVLDGKVITAEDQLDINHDSGWHRTYNDGATTTISVPPQGSIIPVPFPIGR